MLQKEWAKSRADGDAKNSVIQRLRDENEEQAFQLEEGAEKLALKQKENERLSKVPAPVLRSFVSAG